MRALRDFVDRRPFLANVLLIATGTGAGQGVVLLALPLLGRLYAPADFGVWAAFTAVVALLDPLMAGRYELAIPLAESDDKGRHVLALSLLVVLASCAGLGLLLPVIPPAWLTWSLRMEQPGFLAWTLPVALLATAACRSLTYWAIRAHTLQPIAASKFAQGVATALFQILLASTPWRGALGLIVGDILGRLASLAWLLAPAARARALAAIDLGELKSLAARYRQFPLVSSGSVLLNAAGMQLPLLILNGHYGAQVMGFLSAAMRMVGTPSALIGQSAAQVYYGHASRLVGEGRAGLLPFYVSTTRRLFLAGLLPTLAFVLAGPTLCQVVLGPAWTEGGIYLRILGFMFLVQFAVNPVSQTLYILERQWVQLLWDAFRLILVTGAVVLATSLGTTARTSVCVYSAAMLVAYATHLALSYAVLARWSAEAGGSPPEREPLTVSGSGLQREEVEQHQESQDPVRKH